LRGAGALFASFGGFADQPVELGIWRKVFNRRDLAELAHGVSVGRVPAQLLSAPEVEGRVRFEGGGDEDDLSAKRVSRHAPLDTLVGLGEHGVHALAHLLEDRTRERLRPGDVRVDSRIPAQNSPPPIISLMMPMTITNRFKFRPALPREIMPTAAPMIASGMISQLAQPRNGRKAITAQTSATKPMMSETRLNMAGS
jgi:hypothetical protein